MARIYVTMTTAKDYQLQVEKSNTPLDSGLKKICMYKPLTFRGSWSPFYPPSLTFLQMFRQTRRDRVCVDRGRTVFVVLSAAGW